MIAYKDSYDDLERYCREIDKNILMYSMEYFADKNPMRIANDLIILLDVLKNTLSQTTSIIEPQHHEYYRIKYKLLKSRATKIDEIKRYYDTSKQRSNVFNQSRPTI